VRRVRFDSGAGALVAGVALLAVVALASPAAAEPVAPEPADGPSPLIEYVAATAFAQADVPEDPAAPVPLVVVTDTASGPKVEVVPVDDVDHAAEEVAARADDGVLLAVQVDQTVELLDDVAPVEPPTLSVGPSDTLVDTYPQWPLDAPETSFAAAWAASRGAGQVVAVVDTGVYGSHEDLAGAVLPGAQFFGSTGVSSGDGRTDLNGHGTHVAGIIAARAGNGLGIAGAAPEASILPVRVLAPVYENGTITNRASGSSSDVASGIFWAADHGATVINLSLGATGDMPAVDAAIAYAVGKGIPVVAAAGNSGPFTRSYPAAGSDDVIAVAATDRNRQLAPYSSWWPDRYVDVAAPGSGVTSTWSPDAVGTNGARYMIASGTSMATPHVAAALALLRAARPDLGVAALRGVLEGTASDIASPGVDAQTGAGMVDPASALHALAGASGATGAGYRPLPGSRALDTRSGWKLPAGAAIPVQVSGGATGVPWDASAVSLNVTAVEAEGEGFFTVWPATPAGACDAGARPNTSTVNYVLGDVRATGAIIGLGGGGRICVYTSAPAHLLVDVVGYLTPGAGDRLTAVMPLRLVDTRGEERVGPRVLRVPMPATAPAGTSAAVVNVTVTDAQGDGFLTVFPANGVGVCGSPTPTSNLNFRMGMTRANLVYATLGGGALCVYSSVPAHVIVDVTGYLGSGGAAVFVPRTPQRLLDTRLGAGLLRASATGSVAVDPASVAAQLNVTATGPEGVGFLTVWPCSGPQPDTSTVNYRVGETAPNGTTVASGGGAVCFVSNVPTHVIVDVTGTWVPG
jgi:subtilisin family serine protease